MPIELVCFIALVATAIILWAFLPQPGWETPAEEANPNQKENK